MPVRRIPNSHSSVTGRRFQGNGRRVVSSESKLEGDFVTVARFEWPDAIIEGQPVRIYFWENDRRRHYTPDFLVRRPHITPLLLEIKPTEKLVPELQQKFDAAACVETVSGYQKNKKPDFE